MLLFKVNAAYVFSFAAYPLENNGKYRKNNLSAIRRKHLTTPLPYVIIYKQSSKTYRGVEQLEARRAHNPEVVGSSPASATIKTPDFDKKSGVFLTF